MSRRALKAINWAALTERIPESEKHLLASLKAKSDQYLRKVEENPESAPKIDWAHYKKHITVSSMVDSFQKQYESIQIPYPPDNFTAAVDAQGKEMAVEIEKFIQASNQCIELYKAEIVKINNKLPFNKMTMEDFADAYPELALHYDKPSIWPHTPEFDPANIAARMKAGATH